MINGFNECLDINIFIETRNSMGFVRHMINGFLNFKSKNNFNQNDGALKWSNNKHSETHFYTLPLVVDIYQLEC